MLLEWLLESGSTRFATSYELQQKTTNPIPSNSGCLKTGSPCEGRAAIRGAKRWASYWHSSSHFGNQYVYIYNIEPHEAVPEVSKGKIHINQKNMCL